MVEEADIEVELIITQYAQHAHNFVKDCNASQYTAIVTVGGRLLFLTTICL